RSASGKTFATYGLQDVVEVWSSAAMARRRLITTAHGSITQLRFVGGAEDFITSGNDGRLVRWTTEGDQRLLVQSNQPIDNFAMLSASETIVYSTIDGAMWRVDATRQVHALGSRG